MPHAKEGRLLQVGLPFYLIICLNLHKKKMKKIVALLMFTAVLFGCKNYYVHQDFGQKTEAHKTIAILPFDVITTGKKPSNLTDEQLNQLIDAERVAFQISLYNQILTSTNGGKRPINIEVQNFDITNDLILKSGMTLAQASKENPVKMADLLGVDAVQKTRVQKTRYLSDLASFGIDLGQEILDNIPGLGTITDNVPMNIDKTNDIDVSSSIINRKDQSTLYTYAIKQEIDYNTTSTEMVEFINRRIAKTFPYRQEK